jgi:hypothetical protein
VFCALGISGLKVDPMFFRCHSPLCYGLVIDGQCSNCGRDYRGPLQTIFAEMGHCNCVDL